MDKVTKDLYEALKVSDDKREDLCTVCEMYKSQGTHRPDCKIQLALEQYELALKAEALIQDEDYMKWIMEERSYKDK